MSIVYIFLWESFLCPHMVRISETVLFSSKLLKKQNTGICHFCQKYCNNLLTGLWASSAFFLQFTPTIATELHVCFSLIRATVITPTHLSAPALKCFLVGKSTCLPMTEVTRECLLLGSPVVLLHDFNIALILM